MRAVYISQVERGKKFRFNRDFSSPTYVKSESYSAGVIRVYMSSTPNCVFNIKNDRIVWIS